MFELKDLNGEEEVEALLKSLLPGMALRDSLLEKEDPLLLLVVKGLEEERGRPKPLFAVLGPRKWLLVLVGKRLARLELKLLALSGFDAKRLLLLKLLTRLLVPNLLLELNPVERELEGNLLEKPLLLKREVLKPLLLKPEVLKPLLFPKPLENEICVD